MASLTTDRHVITTNKSERVVMFYALHEFDYC